MTTAMTGHNHSFFMSFMQAFVFSITCRNKLTFSYKMRVTSYMLCP